MLPSLASRVRQIDIRSVAKDLVRRQLVTQLWTLTDCLCADARDAVAKYT